MLSQTAPKLKLPWGSKSSEKKHLQELRENTGLLSV